MDNASWDTLSNTLQKFVNESPSARLGQMEFIREAAQSISANSLILDVGAGDAPYREFFQHTNYMTLDWDKSTYRPAIPPDFVTTADNIPCASGTIDGVICTEVLEHVPDPLRVLNEIGRVLRPGGHIWLTAPFVWPLHEQPYDYYRFTSHGLRLLLETSGFESIRVMPLQDSFTTLAQLFRDMAWIIGVGNDGFDDQRALVAGVMNHLTDLIESFSNFDTQKILPIGFASEAVRKHAS